MVSVDRISLAGALERVEMVPERIKRRSLPVNSQNNSIDSITSVSIEHFRLTLLF